jgi:hypothetical protein
MGKDNIIMAEPKIKLNEFEEKVLEKMIKKYGKNYKKMVWDRKINSY